MKQTVFLSIVLVMGVLSVDAQSTPVPNTQTLPLAAGYQEMPIWPAKPGEVTSPEKVRVAETGDHVLSHITRATLTYFPADPTKATGAAIVIAPGGGHIEIWVDHEGYRPAKWLAEHGVACFVLKYRLGKEQGSGYSVDVESQADIQRAIRFVREKAATLHIDTSRIGVMGFSAGGELAAIAAMRYDSVRLTVGDAIDRHSSRPDFQALIYPGNSQRFTVTKQSPPVFILCGDSDGDSISGIAIRMPMLYSAYKRLGVPAELHIYAGISHGFGIRDTNKGAIAEWPERLYEWMQTIHVISL